MHKLNFIFFRLIIIASFFHHSIANAIDDEFDSLLETGHTSREFFPNMEKTIEDSECFNTLKNNHECIEMLKDKINAFPSSAVTQPLVLEEENSDAQDLMDLFNTLHNAEENASNALSAATIPELLELINNTKKIWEDLYKKEQQGRNSIKPVLLYCFKAWEVANLRKIAKGPHQVNDTDLNFPEECYAIKIKNIATKQKVLTAGLRALNLKPCFFSPDSPQIVESNFFQQNEETQHLKNNEKHLQLAIKFLEELNKNFIYYKTLKPTEYLKTISLIEGGHPIPASLYYKLAVLYKRLSMQSNVNSSDLEIELHDRAFHSLVQYGSALNSSSLNSHPPSEETKAIYHERILEIIDRLERWLPAELRKGDNLIYRTTIYNTSRMESSRFLSSFYEKKANEMEEQNLEWTDYLYKTALYADLYYHYTSPECKINTDACEHKKKAWEFANKYHSYIEKNLTSVDEVMFTRLKRMYAVAKNTTENKKLPSLEKILAPLYASKASVENDSVMKSEYFYLAAKNYEVFEDNTALEIATSYILMAPHIKQLIINMKDENETLERATYMFNIVERTLKDEKERKSFEICKKSYFDPTADVKKEEPIVMHTDGERDYTDPKIETNDQACQQTTGQPQLQVTLEENLTPEVHFTKPPTDPEQATKNDGNSSAKKTNLMAIVKKPKLKNRPESCPNSWNTLYDPD